MIKSTCKTDNYMCSTLYDKSHRELWILTGTGTIVASRAVGTLGLS